MKTFLLPHKKYELWLKMYILFNQIHFSTPENFQLNLDGILNVNIFSRLLFLGLHKIFVYTFPDFK